MSKPTTTVTHQPKTLGLMNVDFYRDLHSSDVEEKQMLIDDHAHLHHLSPSECESTSHNHKSCHTSRLRRLLLPAAVTLLGLLVVVAILAYFQGCGEEIVGMVGDRLMRRATGDTSTTEESSFTKNKLYIIVIVVGLFVVVILAVMLSAWCCKGAFQNPLCCPCYLCACCGGLACLECIGCGLCAEGLSEMD